MTNVYTKKSKDTWNAIAHSFDSTRRKTWKECMEFIGNLPKESIVVDIVYIKYVSIASMSTCIDLSPS